MSDFYYDPDTDYDRGARDFGERPLITDDRGGSELMPERDALNALYRAGGVKFEDDPNFEDDETMEHRLDAYAELFEDVFGGGFQILNIEEV